MSQIAIKIQYNMAPSPPPYSWSYVEFYDYEVRGTPFLKGDNSLVKVLGTGLHKLINRTGYGRLTIDFNLQSTNPGASSTLSKLKNVDNYSGDGGRLIIYYKRIDDSEAIFIGIMPWGQIPRDLAIAGMNSGRQMLTVEFLETEKAGGALADYEL